MTPPFADSRLLAAETERIWHQTTPQPLRFVGCNVADEVIAYAPDNPGTLSARLFRGNIADQVYADAYGWPPASALQSPVSNEELVQSGMALVCSITATDWVQAAAARAAQDPSSRRVEVEITRKFFGIPGRSHRYLIFFIPPRR